MEDCYVSVKAHTKYVVGHVWITLADEHGNKTNIEFAPSKDFHEKFDKNPLQKFFVDKSSNAYGLLMQVSSLVYSLAGDMKFNMKRKDDRDDHEVEYKIRISKEQHDSMLSEADRFMEKGGFYQLFAKGDGKDNCCTVIEKILSAGGVNLSELLPEKSYAEKLKSPQSFVNRCIRESKENPDIVIMPIGRESNLTWLSRVAHNLENIGSPSKQV